MGINCKNCGAKNTKDAKYCSACGSLVDEKLVSNKKKELVKTLVFLVTTLVILFVIIYRIQSDFDNFISYELPLNLTVEETKDKLVGSWVSTSDSSILKEISFTENNFVFLYSDESKSLAGNYNVDDSNTVTLYVVLLNDENIGSDMDMQYKLYFQSGDTLIMVFNGITTVFERK